MARLLILHLYLISYYTTTAWPDTDSITPESISKFLKQVGRAIGDLLPCHYTCPNNGYPVPRVGYTPQSNGCGTETTMFTKELASFLPSVHNCCSQHDWCYGSCNKAKGECDDRFRKCLKDICSVVKEMGNVVGVKVDVKEMCTAAVNGLFAIVQSAGCPAYKTAQHEACVCTGASPEL